MIYLTSITDVSQADGAQDIELEIFDEAVVHQLQFSTSATPTAGTLTISIKSPGASDFVALTPTLDMAVGSGIFQFHGYANTLRITPTGFDALKTYSVYVASGIRGI